jgi:TolB-like protein/class 3 adenylate cyclase
MTETRKLAAILVADVVGFSRLAGIDEERTLARLRSLRSDLIDPAIAAHNGHVVKRTGDGALVEFRSVVEAVRCAMEIQTSMVKRNTGLPSESRIEFRIGIHLGDIVEESDGDLMGNGVNIAARLEGIAEPGGICLSEDAYRQVRSHLNLAVSDLGEIVLKNITEAIHIYSLGIDPNSQAGEETLAAATRAPTSPIALSLPDKPSIAVLPFQNMSGDIEQEYFADGIVEEIITALSRFGALFVIARNSTFTYKGRAVDVKQVGRELGVRYVLEGSVRKAGNRVRITGQLIDASTGAHLWADRFDGELADVFDLQDHITSNVVGALAPKLERAEIERAKRKSTDSLDAYDCYLRGMADFHLFTKAGHDDALMYFQRATEIDPSFASALGMTARCYVQRLGYGWVTDRAAETVQTTALARQAAAVGKEDAVALSSAGLALAAVAGELDDGAALVDRALALNQNLAWAWLSGSWVKVYLGEPEAAIERAGRAMRLSPQDPQMFSMQTAIALAHFFAGRDHEALSWAKAAVREQPKFLPASCVAAASACLTGSFAEAQKAMMQLRCINPSLRLANLDTLIPLARQEDFNRWKDGLRQAGLPE